MTSHFSDRTQLFLSGAIAFCIGLLPVVHLLALQVATALILLTVLLRGKSNFTDVPLRFWPYLLMTQFALYFKLNAVVYPSIEGNMRHFQRITLESWSINLARVVASLDFRVQKPQFHGAFPTMGTACSVRVILDHELLFLWPSRQPSESAFNQCTVSSDLVPDADLDLFLQFFRVKQIGSNSARWFDASRSYHGALLGRANDLGDLVFMRCQPWCLLVHYASKQCATFA